MGSQFEERWGQQQKVVPLLYAQAEFLCGSYVPGRMHECLLRIPMCCHFRGIPSI